MLSTLGKPVNNKNLNFLFFFYTANISILLEYMLYNILNSCSISIYLTLQAVELFSILLYNLN